MKRYVNCYPNGLTTTYHTAQEAKERAGHEAYAIAVEVELPDPPQEWKVGDWFQLPERLPMCIAHINPDHLAWFGHNIYGDLRADWMLRSGLDNATPCDPPAWFIEDGAS